MQRKQFSLQQTGGGIMIQFCVYSRHLEEWGWCWDSWNPRAVLGSSWPVGCHRYISEWRSWVYSCTCKLGVRPLLFLIFHQTDGCKLYFYCLYIHLTICCLWQRNRFTPLQEVSIKMIFWLLLLQNESTCTSKPSKLKTELAIKTWILRLYWNLLFCHVAKFMHLYQHWDPMKLLKFSVR
jgi:hypothetical protein